MTAAMLWKILDWTWIASEVAILAATRTRRSTGNVRDRGSLLILWPVIVASITAGSWIGETYAPTMFGGAHWVRTASVAVLVIGLAIRWTAIATLGKAFSANVAIHATQTVRKTGLFRFVRHPSYSGLVLIFVAVGMHTRNWVGLAITLVPTTAALLYRIHVEEAALRQAFGQEYSDYSRATKRLIPGIY
ncbi:MAG TPA: isoprenylcysteine carboxylmethyltransferase family protein [Acidobacteriaceae bacterium]|jgi:protein-S-isoprenylcysteine O-methyltransferase Ste14|nr:isoprenylcysteine carboxylmethyltransferase family protein [Acidobacteriaceae bacterium]